MLVASAARSYRVHRIELGFRRQRDDSRIRVELCLSDSLDHSVVACLIKGLAQVVGLSNELLLPKKGKKDAVE